MLIENLKMMACGGCCTETVRIFTNGASLFAQCTNEKCASVTEITITAPKIDLRWTDNSDGILAPSIR